MRAKDKCPSCFQPVAPDDFLCANCELILQPGLATTRPVGEVSVVRRLLEIPQRGVPASTPTRPQLQPVSLGEPGSEGPTRVMTLPPEVSGVPVVVATLSRPAQLTELEAWVVSLIDGLHDAPALAKKIGFKELELRVLLTVLQSKGVVDFADEPLSDADLQLPAVLGTFDEGEDVPVITGEFDTQLPPPPPLEDEARSTEQHFVPPRITATPARGAGLVVSRGDTNPRNVHERPDPPTDPGTQPTRAPAYPVAARSAPAPREVAPPYPGGPGRASSPSGVQPAPKPTENTDPRIQYSGQANRRVLEALKQVKRVDPSTQAVAREEKEQTFAEVMARDTLQVALRMEQSGRLEEAIRFLEKSISQSPDAPSLYNRLGIILMRERSDYRRAEQLIRRAVELAPDNTVYATNLQQVLSRHALRAQR